MKMIPSKPSLLGFNPFAIPYQGKVIKYLRRDFDHSKGTPEILLSGSVGSAKSILMAHIAVTHCLQNPGARVCLARRAMPDLRRTIYKECIEHIENDLVEGEDYFPNSTSCSIKFRNKSEIISISWADKRFTKGRSLKLSGVVIEELTENSDEDKQAFDTLKSRLRRLPHIKENFLIAATNPGSPSSVWYKYFIDQNESQTRKVFYSVTTDNRFLDSVYIEQLKKDLDPREARRLIYGEWIEINEDKIYHSYSKENNLKQYNYEIDKRSPIIISFDFNIGEGKPMSSVAMQYINGVFHIFDECVVQGARTQDSMEEWFEKGIFKHGCEIVIHGDASGEARNTRSILSDYDIIKKFLANIPDLKFRMEVPRANPPVRSRHNRVNAYCLNAAGEIRLFVYPKAKTADEGLRLTALKKGGDYIEDDSKHYQHITTAIGYAVVYESNKVATPVQNQRRM